MGILSIVSNACYNAGIMTWDVLLTLGNLMLLSHKVGKVTPEGHPGYGGHWPEYKPPQEGDSRCSCPAINAMANHGIISRTGRGVKFTELNAQIRTTYNFSPSFCSFVPHYAARMLNKNYHTDTFDLHELDLHNGIEHDASLTRRDAAFEPNQGTICIPFIEEMLDCASGSDAEGGKLLTKRDLSRMLGKRRAESKASNQNYTQSTVHRLFGSTNASTLLTIFGGRVEDIRSILIEEQIPKGWEPRVRSLFGLTLLAFNFTVLPVEFGVRQQEWEPADTNKQKQKRVAGPDGGVDDA